MSRKLRWDGIRSEAGRWGRHRSFPHILRRIYLWLLLLRRDWRESLHWVPGTGTRWRSAHTQDTQCSQHIIQSDHFKRSASDSWFPQGNLHDRSLLPTSLNSILPLFCSFTLLPPYWPPLSSSRCCNPCCKQPHYFPPKVLNFPSPFLVFSSSWGISPTLSSSVQHPQKAFPDYIIKWTPLSSFSIPSLQFILLHSASMA